MFLETPTTWAWESSKHWGRKILSQDTLDLSAGEAQMQVTSNTQNQGQAKKDWMQWGIVLGCKSQTESWLRPFSPWKFLAEPARSLVCRQGPGLNVNSLFRLHLQLVCCSEKQWKL